MIAPLRIQRSVAAGDGGDGIKNWMDRLTKLVPSEILAVYVAGRGYAKSIADFWPLICLGLLIAVRVWGTRLPGGGPQTKAVMVASVSFLIWVLAIGGTLPGLSRVPGTQQQDLAQLAVLVWTTIVPVFYKGD